MSCPVLEAVIAETGVQDGVGLEDARWCEALGCAWPDRQDCAAV